MRQKEREKGRGLYTVQIFIKNTEGGINFTELYFWE